MLPLTQNIKKSEILKKVNTITCTQRVEVKTIRLMIGHFCNRLAKGRRQFHPRNRRLSFLPASRR